MYIIFTLIEQLLTINLITCLQFKKICDLILGLETTVQNALADRLILSNTISKIYSWKLRHFSPFKVTHFPASKKISTSDEVIAPLWMLTDK